MQKQKTWQVLLNHLSEEDSDTEKEIFLKWLDQNEKNKILFYNVKKCGIMRLVQKNPLSKAHPQHF